MVIKERERVKKQNQKKKKLKEVKLPILFWPFVGSLFWSLTHLLACAIVSTYSWPHIFLALVVLFQT